MKKAIVIYTSKRGSTRQYAEWIAEDLGCEAVAFDPSDKTDLSEYDCIVYGGWIRGSGIVDFDRFSARLGRDFLSRLIVFGVGIADETPDNYMQVWGYSIGKTDPHNEGKALLYILGGRYVPSEVRGFDKLLMKIMRGVMLSGSTKDSKDRAEFMRDRIDNGIDMVRRDNITSLVRDAKKKLDVL